MSEFHRKLLHSPEERRIYLNALLQLGDDHGGDIDVEEILGESPDTEASSTPVPSA